MQAIGTRLRMVGQIINPDSVLVGRAVTTTFMPGRPDVWKAIDSLGKKEGRRAQNVWAVEMLVKGDVYVADQFGAKRNGPTIGDNVGNAIYAKTGNGIVYDGALRDVEGLKKLEALLLFLPVMIHLFIIPEVDKTEI